MVHISRGINDPDFEKCGQHACYFLGTIGSINHSSHMLGENQATGLILMIKHDCLTSKNQPVFAIDKLIRNVFFLNHRLFFLF